MNELVRFDIIPNGKETKVNCVIDDISADLLLSSAGTILTTTYNYLASNDSVEINEGALWLKSHLKKALKNDDFWDAGISILPDVTPLEDTRGHEISFIILEDKEHLSVECKTEDKMTYMDLLYALACTLHYVYDMMIKDKDEQWNMMGELMASSFSEAADNEDFWNSKISIIDIADNVNAMWDKSEQLS